MLGMQVDRGTNAGPIEAVVAVRHRAARCPYRGDSPRDYGATKGTRYSRDREKMWMPPLDFDRGITLIAAKAQFFDGVHNRRRRGWTGSRFGVNAGVRNSPSPQPSPAPRARTIGCFHCIAVSASRVTQSNDLALARVATLLETRPSALARVAALEPLDLIADSRGFFVVFELDGKLELLLEFFEWL